MYCKVLVLFVNLPNALIVAFECKIVKFDHQQHACMGGKLDRTFFSAMANLAQHRPTHSNYINQFGFADAVNVYRGCEIILSALCKVFFGRWYFYFICLNKQRLFWCGGARSPKIQSLLLYYDGGDDRLLMRVVYTAASRWCCCCARARDGECAALCAYFWFFLNKH